MDRDNMPYGVTIGDIEALQRRELDANSRSFRIASMIITVLALAIITISFLWMVINAALKEQAFNDNIRASRCAEMGENMPQYMKSYCDKLGV